MIPMELDAAIETVVACIYIKATVQMAASNSIEIINYMIPCEAQSCQYLIYQPLSVGKD
jgi:hypothetical protein